MIAIRSYVPSLLTFPGVILRQAVHLVTCRMLKVEVLDIRYFRFDTPAGYVVHEMPKRFGSSLALAFIPLLIHSALCFAICLPALVPLRFYDEGSVIPELFQLWIGLSIGAHAFPPSRDCGNLWDLARLEVRNHGAGVRLTFPLVALLRIAQKLSLFGFDVAFAVLVGIGIPWVLLDRIFPT